MLLLIGLGSFLVFILASLYAAKSPPVWSGVTEMAILPVTNTEDQDSDQQKSPTSFSAVVGGSETQGEYITTDPSYGLCG